MSKPTISFILLAYNEQHCIAQAIRDCRVFAQTHCASYEVLVIDDGSSDDTNQIAIDASEDGDVRVITHPHNAGMGASMRDGYLAARCDYLVHLPGDRQVRAEALEEMVGGCAKDRVVLSQFSNPPSGRRRAAMSVAFRLLTRHVGGLRVDFAGTYLFHRDWLSKVDLTAASSDTFLFSFQLLELFRRAGASFSIVTIPTHLREQGTSRVATLPRVVSMFMEIGKARMG